MADHNDLGKSGEELAAAHLRAGGYTVLETNWRFRQYELDIVAEKDNILVFCEVKTRKSNFFGEPEEFVNRAKQKNLIAAANAYLSYHKIDKEARFDIVSVILTSAGHRVTQIEDAFYPTL